MTAKPLWSPSGGVLVYGSLSGGPSVFEDLEAGTSRELDLVWPVAFDASGTLLYSPAWSFDREATDIQTTVVDASTGDVVGQMPGTPPSDSLRTD